MLDLVVLGNAYAPNDKPAKKFATSVKFATHEKSLIITGPRHWLKKSLDWVLDEPCPITSLALKYEYAFGGRQLTQQGETICCLNNNYGVGWYNQAMLADLAKKTSLPAAQIYAAAHPPENISANLIAQGYGFFGRAFQQRLQYSGSCDENWQQTRHPLLPTDFNLRYFNGAHPDFQFKHPKPQHKYQLTITGMTRSVDCHKQSFSLELPVETLFAYIKTANNIGFCKDLVLDTIVVDVELRKIYCSYRLALAEELHATQVQLRYIPASEIKTQLELAQELRHSNAPTFIPLPPSVATLQPTVY